MGKSSINGPFSMAMLNNQRVPLLFLFMFPMFLELSTSVFVVSTQRRTKNALPLETT